MQSDQQCVSDNINMQNADGKLLKKIANKNHNK